jgi:predicted ATP-dependent endonuclease of OLD family
MIDHIFIKNYKAFERENIPLDKFSLLIGSNNSGKTTVLEAMNLFFNTKIQKECIRDTKKDVVIEIHINEERYRKTYSPPTYNINYEKCIGDMFDINHIKFLYIPKQIDNKDLLNNILSINYTQKTTPVEQAKIVKIFDYIDGQLGNSNYPLFSIQTDIKMDIKEDIDFTKEQYTTMLSNITYPYLIIGIDNVEDNFDLESIRRMTKYSYQTLFTTNDNSISKEFDYTVHALYRENIKEEFDTVLKVVNNHKKYILVEGKYDVAWFEKALHLLDLYEQYRVIPCGGFGNIQYVKKQLNKEGFKTIVITDGDVDFDNALQKDVIELYGDVDYINSRFGTKFHTLPEKKYEFFKQIKVKDDIVKKVLSSWARKHLTLENVFVQELQSILVN